MKLSQTSLKNPRTLAVAVLLKQKEKGVFVQEELDQKFETVSLSKKDRGLCFEIVLGTLRNTRLLDALLKPYYKKSVNDLIHIILQTALYQSLFLDRIPEHAVIAETMKTADHFKINHAASATSRCVLLSPLVTHAT